MTRFARAKGSKASNEKAPEDGTPWEVMKDQLEKAKKDSEEAKKREEAEKQRIDNYEKFLKEHKTQKRTATWCEFPEVQQNKKLAPNVIDKNKPGTKPNKKSKLKNNKLAPENFTQETTQEINLTINTKEPATKSEKKKCNNVTPSESSAIVFSNLDLPSQAPEQSKKKKKSNKSKESTNKTSQNNVHVTPSNNTAESNKNVTKNQQNTNTKKKNKKFLDGQPSRRKPVNDHSFQLMINGKDVKLVRFDGFPIMEKDAERLNELRNNMLQKGIPKSEIQRTMKLERRRAEKALARMKKDVCYNCRKGGHNLSDCPDLKTKIPGVDAAADGMCFKCGSTEHRQFECKVQRDKEFRFATCFICKEPGHIARQCPDNPKGLYPNGGGCKLCGDVTHLRKDCPTGMDKKEVKSIKLSTLDNVDNLEDIEQQNTGPSKPSTDTSKKPKKIKF